MTHLPDCREDESPPTFIIQKPVGEEMEDMALSIIATKSPVRTRALSDIGLLEPDSKGPFHILLCLPSMSEAHNRPSPFHLNGGSHFDRHTQHR